MPVTLKPQDEEQKSSAVTQFMYLGRTTRKIKTTCPGVGANQALGRRALELALEGLQLDNVDTLEPLRLTIQVQYPTASRCLCLYERPASWLWAEIACHHVYGGMTSMFLEI